MSCNDILKENTMERFSFEELKTLKFNPADDLELCLTIAGSERIGNEKSELIWSSLKKIYDSVNDIPESILQKLGWLIVGIDVADIYNLTISDVDTITTFGIYRNLSMNQLIAFKISIQEQWRSKTPDQLTCYDLMALRQILCAFNSSEISLIPYDSYRDAANELSTIMNCQKNVLTELAKLAVNNAAFGDVNTWSSAQVATVGCIMAGLSTLRDIPAESMGGITSAQVQCLPTYFLQSLSGEQLSHFSTSAAFSISEYQRNSLSEDQNDALYQVIKGATFKHDSSSSLPSHTSKPKLFLLIC